MSDINHPSGAPWRNFYGRISGKTMRDRQKRLLDEMLPRLSPGPVSVAENPDRAPVDLASLFPGQPLWLEVGFGGGEHMAHLAQTNPAVGLIGCEPFLNAVAMTLMKIADRDLADRIRIHPWDVRELFEVLPGPVFDRAYLLYPYPWPKARHHLRRFVTPEHLAPLHRVMLPGALFHVATDIPDYVRQTLEEVPPAGFDLLPGDIHTPWDGWFSTRYEQKALREGRRPHYMVFRRR
jgi:tRNA (guanine-N7-)-methyltransferase